LQASLACSGDSANQFFAFSTPRSSLSAIIPQTQSNIQKGDGDGWKDRVTGGHGGAGRHVGVSFGRRRTDHGGAGRERGAGTGQRHPAHGVLEARSVTPLSELNAQLEKQGFYKAFPPPGIEVVSWYIMMGIG
jgi:hypothetical protein